MSPAAALNADVAPFSDATWDWFKANFDEPTAVQKAGWAHITKGCHTLLLAPTGSGKTLAAFLGAIDKLANSSPDQQRASESQRCKVLYVSPLKALTADVERNLRAPLNGIALAAQKLGRSSAPIEVAVRTGDTPAAERRHLLKYPPEILVTTPESLYLLLTSSSQKILGGIETVIIDEIHALVGSKRGAHLAVSLERLERLVIQAGNPPFQRIGCSATQRPADVAARFLGGMHRPFGPQSSLVPRAVEIADAGITKRLDIEVVLPVRDMAALGSTAHYPTESDTTESDTSESDAELVMAGAAAGDPALRSSIWPHIYPALVDLVRKHNSTLIFVNSRRLAERLAAKLNEVSGEDIARAHHGSLAREQRSEIEDALKAGRLPVLVATSSLELGIDMGAIDLVIQVEAPSSISSGLQRIGRAGHSVQAPSAGKIFPKYRHDLLVSAVCVNLMQQGKIETSKVPRNPLDVLAQQIIAIAAAQALQGEPEVISVADLRSIIEGSYSFAELPDSAFEAVLDLCSGRYPSDQFGGLRPRLNWDRAAGTLQARAGARMLSVTSGGTIADRGTYAVFTPGGSRVGELDEEMVYECRTGETFLLGASSWRILEITRDRVVVEPAPGIPAKMPFWHGDKPGRPFELGREIGKFLAEFDDWSDQDLTKRCGLDQSSIRNLRQYIQEEREATSGLLPTDTQIVIQRFRDELGDWRLCVLSPFGGRVHAAWAMVVEAKAKELLDGPVQAVWSDDGIVLRLGDGDADELPSHELLFVQPDEVVDLVVSQLADTPLFAARFRENAARALLLPRRFGGSRSPLWLQRQKAADLLAIAKRYRDFPILVETYRECLSDLFEIDSLVALMAGVSSRRIAVANVELAAPSPFAASLVFSYVANFMYDGDAPLAERKAQALVLDKKMLSELLGSEELRELIDSCALEELEEELAGCKEQYLARNLDEVSDVLRRLGDLTAKELADRCHRCLGDPMEAISNLLAKRRAVTLRVGGEERLVAVEDVGRYRDGLGCVIPGGIAQAYLTAVPDALLQLLRRWARNHGPFSVLEPAKRFGISQDAVRVVLADLLGSGTVVRGEFRPSGSGEEWCDATVLRQLRQRSIAALRNEVAPVDPATLGRLLPLWQGVASKAAGLQRCWDVIEQLQGYPLPASILESEILASRIQGYTPSMLDELIAAGEVMWVGAGPLGPKDGRVVLLNAELAPGLLSRLSLTGSERAAEVELGTEHERLRQLLADRGASFFRDMLAPASSGVSPDETLRCLWDLVWQGEATNDSFSALRSMTQTSRSGPGRTRLGRRGPSRRLTHLPLQSHGRWSLVSAALSDQKPNLTIATANLVQVLLNRHGILTREVVRSESVPGGFASLYPVLSAMEESGKLRRGYFIEGLGAAQFALPGALEHLRSARGLGATTRTESVRAGQGPLEANTVILPAADPANPFGAALAWPVRGPSRSAGAWVVICDGLASLYLERGAHSVISLREPSEFAEGAWETCAVQALASLLASRRVRRLVLRKYPSELRPWLIAQGFVPGPSGLELYGTLSTPASDRQTMASDGE